MKYYKSFYILNKKILLNTIDDILSDEDRLKNMSENAKKLGVTDSSSKIVEVIEELVGGPNVWYTWFYNKK